MEAEGTQSPFERGKNAPAVPTIHCSEPNSLILEKDLTHSVRQSPSKGTSPSSATSFTVSQHKASKEHYILISDFWITQRLADR
jgi:hypothetical protein